MPQTQHYQKVVDIDSGGGVVHIRERNVSVSWYFMAQKFAEGPNHLLGDILTGYQLEPWLEYCYNGL